LGINGFEKILVIEVVEKAKIKFSFKFKNECYAIKFALGYPYLKYDSSICRI